MRWLMMALLVLVSSAHAETRFYYELGTTTPISSSLAYRPDIVIGVSFGLRTRFQCGQFSFDTSVGNLLANARDRLRTQFAGFAQSAMAALPALVLQKINPGLYDLFQNLMVRAEADVRVSLANCRTIEQALDSDEPFKKLIRESISYRYQEEGEETGGADITATQREVEETAGEAGIPWCDETHRGGLDQEPIRPVMDTAKAGYAALAGHINDCTDTTPPPNDDAGLNQAFDDGEQAAEWIAQVVGDYEIALTEQSIRHSTIGTGLSAQLNRNKQITEATLKSVVTSGAPFSGQARELLSPPNTIITNQLIEELKNFDASEQDQMIQRLAADIEYARVIHRAFAAKRILRAGQDVPEIANSTAVQQYIQRAIGRLDQHIEDLSFEYGHRQRTVADTAIAILDRSRAMKAAVNADRDPINPNPRQIGRDGAIRVQEEGQP